MLTDKRKTLALEKHSSFAGCLHQAQSFIAAGVPCASTAPNKCRAHCTFNAMPATVPLRPKILLISDIQAYYWVIHKLNRLTSLEGEGQNQNFLKICNRNL